MLQVMERALPSKPLEQAAKISGIDVASAGNFTEGLDLEKLLLNKLPTTLVGFESGRRHRVMRDRKVGDFHQQILERNHAHPFPVGVVAEPVLDEVVEDPLDRLGVGDLPWDSGQNLTFLEQLQTLASAECHKIFGHGRLRMRGDFHRNIRPVNKDRAWDELDWFIFHSERSGAACDKFQDQIGEPVAADLVIGPAFLVAAAHHGEPSAFTRIEFKIKALGLGDLGAEILGLRHGEGKLRIRN